ncbi:hypothetical protein [Delftia phage PhiW-14]|uniref:Uncharacterized protein n=1 Tax=Delftia phage PhiW-14 TaxID=665032 RepID=C9DGC3_BPW14|nr:hypothetical protein DP-phiW-14_gp153 [Delftia phage PhiW-14]ACV50174.1 hypothetical protein [Delftia phage PhiW-14]
MAQKPTKSELAFSALAVVVLSASFAGSYYQDTPEHKAKKAQHQADQLRQQTICVHGVLFIDQKGVKSQILSPEGKGLPCKEH